MSYPTEDQLIGWEEHNAHADHDGYDSNRERYGPTAADAEAYHDEEPYPDISKPGEWPLSYWAATGQWALHYGGGPGAWLWQTTDTLGPEQIEEARTWVTEALKTAYGLTVSWEVVNGFQVARTAPVEPLPEPEPYRCPNHSGPCTYDNCPPF